MSKYFFTADEHYGHTAILEYAGRPFENIRDMETKFIENHNSVVGKADITVHIGDFCMLGASYAKEVIKQLNGNHIFVKGSHDWWLKGADYGQKYIREFVIDNQTIVCCHYAMRRWAKSHYGSWQLYGHSHGRLPPIGFQYDVGVDPNHYYPVEFHDICFIMEEQFERLSKQNNSGSEVQIR